MTAAVELLRALRARGVILEREGNRLRVRPASALSTEELEALRQVKPEVLRLLAARPTTTPACHLRVALRRWFALTVAEADGIPSDPQTIEALRQEVIRLEDDTGFRFARALIREERERFRQQTGRCGLCGGPGHDRDEVGPHA